MRFLMSREENIDMNTEVKAQLQIRSEEWEKVLAAIDAFALPGYSEIPDVGLFLEQTSRYICSVLDPLYSFSLTGSMISNYVKKKLIANPVKKMYGREQIAYLFFITVAKSVLSLEDIQTMLELQKNTYEPERAYEYFRSELKNFLLYVFALRENPELIGSEVSTEKELLRNIIITASHKVYLDSCFRLMR